MSEYTKEILQDKVERFGEVFIVLESDREYEVHGTEQLAFTHAGSNAFDEVRLEGTADDGTYQVVEFPISRIEHVYTHREL